MQQWAQVEEYLGNRVVRPDGQLQAIVAATTAAGLPPIEVSAAQGKFLMLLARISGARRILEIGTLGGFSTAWLARALPDGGELVTCEYEPRHAEVARANLAAAGLLDRVTIRVGAALDTLPELAESEPFDLFFIDADKVNNPAYLEWAVKLSHPGSVIVVDNVVRGGSILDPDGDDAVQGTRAAVDILGSHPSLDATALQTVGTKGWDGFALALVL
ncbi:MULTISPECIES: O-methyltransferase [unclassified Arthrobacter]|uniref:O-methyltransferase n=1 Tax=unclassified Arthrobacter TaxID=235627 RepID=UPI001E2A1D30|nr:MULTISPECIES: O-methyltransferase [unclassified Arthrobacter]MCC9144127.1 O-methyltransferase [Arthrobacter sp. zg-Y919]MDK1275352.1 O-methyltransferase [Arthrobacter sp. zg.Y919]MDM7990984.1 O-methyltransferase [Arthrobacter sp. zg-Y877]WIB03259.1 O-methyltransferase [Arthrobacter sp. zg-Y919]